MIFFYVGFANRHRHACDCELSESCWRFCLSTIFDKSDEVTTNLQMNEMCASKSSYGKRYFRKSGCNVGDLLEFSNANGDDDAATTIANYQSIISPPPTHGATSLVRVIAARFLQCQE